MLFGQSPGPAYDYWLDAWQRAIFFLDILRQRGDTVLAHEAETAPNVLTFQAELVMHGRDLPRPVNYGLVRIVPPPEVAIDPAKAPFVVVDPRAGHGPGIGGMKHDSEIGVALRAGHPCYFVGFLPEPVPGQTVEDICRAEAAFVEEVARRHPEAPYRPVVIANCQAGWQTMMAAALRPELMGPILLAGAPLSYWAGVRRANPLRYLGGLLGGTWLTALTGDLGCGIFDGAWLVRNFEALNPAHTLWEKPYNVYSKVDTEGPRFIDFETWWGSPVLLNAGEMQWIADNLFVGNKLSSGALRTSDGVRSTCATSSRRSSSSAPGVTTSPRRSRRWAGSPTSTTTSARSPPTARPSSTPCTSRSDTWGSSSPARSRTRSMTSSPPAWT
jgi:hypothetical protein